MEFSRYMKKSKNTRDLDYENDKEFENYTFWIERGVDIMNRKIMISESISEEAVSFVMRGLMKMISDNKNPIDVYVNSYGGDVYDGLALYDALEEAFEKHGIIIRTHGTGKIMSMGFIIYLSGIERYASKRSTFMHHEISSTIEGKTEFIKYEIKEQKRLEKIRQDILVKKTKMSLSWWKKNEKHMDLYFDIHKARELGIVNK